MTSGRFALLYWLTVFHAHQRPEIEGLAPPLSRGRHTSDHATKGHVLQHTQIHHLENLESDTPSSQEGKTTKSCNRELECTEVLPIGSNSTAEGIEWRLGQRYWGITTSIKKLGIFLDIFGIRCLMHISETPAKTYIHVNKLYKRGDQFWVKILYTPPPPPNREDVHHDYTVRTVQCHIMAVQHRTGT